MGDGQHLHQELAQQSRILGSHAQALPLNASEQQMAAPSVKNPRGKDVRRS